MHLVWYCNVDKAMTAKSFRRVVSRCGLQHRALFNANTLARYPGYGMRKWMPQHRYHRVATNLDGPVHSFASGICIG